MTTNISPGDSLTFRVSARNIQGFGPVSSTSTVIAADAPDIMTQPLVSVNRSDETNLNV